MLVLMYIFYENWQTNVNKHPKLTFYFDAGVYFLWKLSNKCQIYPKWTFLRPNWSWEKGEYTHVIQKVPIHIILMLVYIFYGKWQTNVKKTKKDTLKLELKVRMKWVNPWYLEGVNSCHFDAGIHFLWKLANNWNKIPQMDILRLKLKTTMRWVHPCYAEGLDSCHVDDGIHFLWKLAS